MSHKAGFYAVDLKSKQGKSSWSECYFDGESWHGCDVEDINRVIGLTISSIDVMRAFSAAMEFIEASPVDPDITAEQRQAAKKMLETRAEMIRNSVSRISFIRP